MKRYRRSAIIRDKHKRTFELCKKNYKNQNDYQKSEYKSKKELPVLIFSKSVNLYSFTCFIRFLTLLKYLKSKHNLNYKKEKEVLKNLNIIFKNNKFEEDVLVNISIKIYSNKKIKIIKNPKVSNPIDYDIYNSLNPGIYSLSKKLLIILNIK